MEILNNLKIGKDLCSFEDAIHLMEENQNGCIHSLGLVTRKSRGFVYSYDGNYFAIIIGKEFSPYVYRGENKVYSKFTPSLKRCDSVELKIISDYKKSVFTQIFKTTPYYKRITDITFAGRKMKFDFEAISQHYGFLSNYLDITRDIDVAKFFAYTYYDKEKDMYFPITDFSEYTPMLYKLSLKDIDWHHIKPISFQSVPRPMSQSAMAIDCSESSEWKDKFSKFELPKDANVAKEIYNRFEKGRKLWNNDPVVNIIKEINNYQEITNWDIDRLCNKYQINKNQLFDILSCNRVVEKYSMELDDKLIYRINKYIDNIAIKFIKKLDYRLCSESIQQW